MALTATVYHFKIEVSDVDRGVYEKFDLRLARHPSESMRFLLTRTLAYCLSYRDDLAFSKGGLSSSDDPCLSAPSDRGGLALWIDVGSPSAERMHKATKAADEVEIYTHVDIGMLRREAASRPIHRVETIAVRSIPAAFLTELEKRVDVRDELEVVRNEGQLYVTVRGQVIECSLVSHGLVE